MVREEDEPKKKSWFSRKKKSTPATSPRVPRPPSVMSHPSHHRKTSSSASTDDDLPPREAHTPSLATTDSRSTTPTPGDLGKDSQPSTPDVSHLPKHAGFDFSAIKDVIGKADLNPGELQVPAPNRFHAPPIPPPTLRSESAPPPIPEPSSPSPKPRSSLDMHDQPVAGPSSSRSDLSSTLARSMSLDNVHAEADDAEELTSVNAITPHARHEFQSFAAPPSLSFGSNDGSVWPAEPEGTRTPFGTSALGSFRERPTFTASSPSGFTPYGMSRTQDYFALPDSASMSFAGADGSITFSSSPSRTEPPDPWDIPSSSFGGYNAKKSSNTLNGNLNPWQS